MFQEDVSREEAVRLVTSLSGSQRVRFYEARVDRSGLEVTVGDRQLVVPPV
jgi:hypothetical protein